LFSLRNASRSKSEDDTPSVSMVSSLILLLSPVHTPKMH
jgi:hypothetical protein